MAGPQLDREHLESIARMFQVLGEPTRLAILQALQSQPHTVNELVLALDARQANISKQLGLLHDMGLVQRTRQGSRVCYSVGDPIVYDLCRLVCDKLHRDARRQFESMQRFAREPEPSKLDS